MTTYTRSLVRPERSFFLLGPRATGKTTWLRSVLPEARRYDLLREHELVRLTRDPGQLRREVAALPHGTWVVIDEVQRLPQLLDEVHALMAEEPDRYRFALTGSSARKLRRGDVNLLAGRVISRRFYPLTLQEIGDVEVDSLLRWGGLPLVRSASSDADRVDLLEAYSETYLAQEIRAEAVVRGLASFTRFLQVAALANGQVTNTSAIARDAAVARPTVQGWFDVLQDTLVGAWLPAWRPRAKIKEQAHPKFYFFDTGAVRSLSGRLREPIDGLERGHLLETWVFHELRAHISYSGCGGELAYWRTPSGSEVDFVWTRGDRAVAIEVKASDRWRPEHGRALGALTASGVAQRTLAVYLGSERLRDGALHVLPMRDFAADLHAGLVLT